MALRERRLARGWSQEDLAAASGVSTRTIQRIERGQEPGPETIRSLAAAFETNVETLRKGMTMTATSPNDISEHVRGLQLHLAIFVLVILVLTGVAVFATGSPGWVLWVVVFWLMGIAIHAVSVRIMYGPFRLF